MVNPAAAVEHGIVFLSPIQTLLRWNSEWIVAQHALSNGNFMHSKKKNRRIFPWYLYWLHWKFYFKSNLNAHPVMMSELFKHSVPVIDQLDGAKFHLPWTGLSFSGSWAPPILRTNISFRERWWANYQGSLHKQLLSRQMALYRKPVYRVHLKGNTVQEKQTSVLKHVQPDTFIFKAIVEFWFQVQWVKCMMAV